MDVKPFIDQSQTSFYRYENEWSAIKGVTLLPPQKGLAIPYIMSASPIADAVQHRRGDTGDTVQLHQLLKVGQV